MVNPRPYYSQGLPVAENFRRIEGEFKLVMGERLCVSLVTNAYSRKIVAHHVTVTLNRSFGRRAKLYRAQELIGGHYVTGLRNYQFWSHVR